ncbi:CPBP family intramembrane glutamic endopeptidase [Nocardioides sp. zg-1228]|uniref:CPBP family intramembrane glutamic endopeptidase n=1 Tax=Nocardioides sp. zg-1228 TaxID=2763008 RepID=UPI001642E9B6|nr:CPBP family intramembrane glutamic endopeptidase [Nocardioides sp. zg-1228]MBC2933310.1 CPBP family intramembrane metalloprotease [Nocardioides sp. zg-1228]QSF56531.1 CPBP family intramembrane metalloprotease [Nocardioides sp. zg-1228]
MTRSLSPDFRPRYHELHRVGRPGAWRSVVGGLLLLVLVFGVVPLAAGALALVLLLATGDTAEEAAALLDVTQEATPAGLALLNAIIAAAIPLTFLVTWWLHRLKPRWVSSVAPRLRWGYLLVCLGLSLVALMASLGVAMLLPISVGDVPAGTVNDFTTQTRDFIIVILLLTPLQAAGEEYLFRGYLTQAFGSLVWGRRVSQALGVLGPALIFALFHGLSQDWPVFFDRFAFGVVAGILVIRTGGLEAPIAMHVLNNFLAFGLALAFGDLTTALNAEGGSSWWTILSTMTQSLVYLFLASWVAKAMGLADVGPPVGGAALPPGQRDPVLAPPPPRM